MEATTGARAGRGRGLAAAGAVLAVGVGSALYVLLLRNLVHGWGDLPNGGSGGGQAVLVTLAVVPLAFAGAFALAGRAARWTMPQVLVFGGVLLGMAAIGAVLVHEIMYPRLYST